MNNLRKLPKIDKLIEENEFNHFAKNLLTKIVKEKVDILRKKLLSNEIVDFVYTDLINDVKVHYNDIMSSSLKPLINATGIILHTNMGRSLISEEIMDKISSIVCNYSNLEYNLDKGCRGERYEHVSKHLKVLLDVEDILVVNNNASAVFLILNTFSKQKETIVSRGELVEIGGSFRIPEVMKNSGAILNEVGATNKTNLSDYENEINENTSILMKVHKSNYSIEGFSSEVSFQDLSILAKKYDLIDYYDLGSGYIPTLPYGLSTHEAPISKILNSSASLISFSGDKLFASVQAGIIAGKKELIDKLKKNQLLRMLRVDKITLSIIEETAKAYLAEDYKCLPTLNMLFQSLDNLEKRVLIIQNNIPQNISNIIKTKTYMGGGTLPNKSFPSIALHIEGKVNTLEIKFRKKGIIGRIENDKFLLDFRSIIIKDDVKIIKIINNIFGK
jgi:L-seryl-tRNA(Ser) seleniumtransferase